jgi:predicted DNA-binding protein with PD1-like motif
MEFSSLEIGKIHILRIDPGEDILSSVEQFIAEANLKQAVVLGGYGTMAAYHLHWVTHNRIPTDNLFRKGEGGIEILAMNGLVVEGKPHIHISLSTPDGAFGGHLEPGCIAYVLCEVFFAELAGPDLARVRTHVSVEGMGEGEVPRLMFGRQETN